MPLEKLYATYASLGPKTAPKEYSCMEVQNLEHRHKLLKENTIVCVDLYANWCEPCKGCAPQFAALAEQYNNPGRCMLIKEDVDLELTRDFQISGIPAFIFYINGRLYKENGVPVSVTGGDVNQVRRILEKIMGSLN